MRQHTGAAVPAGTRDGADRLAAVAGKVKATLDLDTGRYGTFNGRLTEGELAPVWQLSWSGKDGSMEISATETGSVLSYYRDSAGEEPDILPLKLPEGNWDRAKEAAAAFLSRVLGPGETADLNGAADRAKSLGQTRLHFQGNLRLNGRPSPLGFSLSVRLWDCAVVQFYRDGLETGYLGAVPPAGFRMEAREAGTLLRGTLSLRLEYVRDGDGKRAVLRYLPNHTDDFYVDDCSGALVDLTKLREELDGGAANGAVGAMRFAMSAAKACDECALTEAEQLGADKLRGTLDREALDRTARNIPELGLDGYALAAVSCREEEFSGGPVIAARLSYVQRTQEDLLRRWVTLNAKSGELLEVSSAGRREDSGVRQVDQNAARRRAEDFLTRRQGERFARCGAYAGAAAIPLTHRRRGTWSFCYARREQGWFFPEDRFAVEIDAVDGAVSAYSQCWTQALEFDSPTRLIPMEQAVDAWFRTFEVTGGYVAVPRKPNLSDPACARLMELDRRALNSLELGWYLTPVGKRAEGIDPVTGMPIRLPGGEGGTLQYSDPAGDEAEALAQYGIGYAGGRFQPEKPLIQLDWAVLLASTQGVRLDPDKLSEEDADRVCRTVWGMGALQRGDREDDRRLSRLDVIRSLLDAGGYRPAARLQGIYRTDLFSEEEVPGPLLGYAALARGMGLAAGRLDPGRPAARGDAAALLLAFLRRD